MTEFPNGSLNEATATSEYALNIAHAHNSAGTIKSIIMIESIIMMLLYHNIILLVQLIVADLDVKASLL